MARIRTIKPEFWTDGDMLKISRDARLFYIGLWNFCDDNGVLEYEPVSIKARIFPNDRISVDNLLKELANIGKVIIYEVENRPYIFIKNLINHQVIDRPRKSKLPLPEGNQLKSIEISLGRKEGRKEGKGKERNGMEVIPMPPKSKFLEFVLLTKDEHQTLCERLGETATKEYIERLNNYIGAKGVKYKSHYHAILTWSKRDVSYKVQKSLDNQEGVELLSQAKKELGRMAKADDIAKWLKKLPKHLHGSLRLFLIQTYPKDGDRAYGNAERMVFT